MSGPSSPLAGISANLINPSPSNGGLDLYNPLPFKGRVRVGMGGS